MCGQVFTSFSDKAPQAHQLHLPRGDSVTFMPNWISSPWGGDLAPLFPVLFYKEKVWWWNPYCVSPGSISTWSQGAWGQGVADKAFPWPLIPPTVPQLIPCPFCPHCNDFCHRSMSERGHSQPQVGPSKQVSGYEYWYSLHTARWPESAKNTTFWYI